MQTLRNAKVLAFVSVLVAVCLAIQLAPRPPNVEFTSFFTFAVGFMFGSLIGVSFGSLIMFVNGFFSPWGFAGLNMPFQMVGMSLIGLAGGVYRKYAQSYSTSAFFVEASILGAILTVVYDLITNLGVALSYMVIGMDPTLAITAAIAYGAPFSLIHIFSNNFVFGVAFSPLVRALNHVPAVKNLG